jgi:hypothetical protein
MEAEQMMHGGIAMAVQCRRKEILGVAMRQLRQQVHDGEVSIEDLDILLNTVEALAAALIQEG